MCTAGYHPVKLTLAECGELLGYSYPSMLRLAHREDFPSFMCMGRWIVVYDLLLEWLRKQATDNTLSQ